MKKKIFLSIPFEDSNQSKLKKSLERAGFDYCYSDDQDNLKDTICSVHYISDDITFPEQHSNSINDFSIAKNIHTQKSNYKSFFWNPTQFNSIEKPNPLLDKIQNELKNNMILSSSPYVIQFVEDIFNIIEEQDVKKYDTTPADIYLICSESDQKETSQIQLILSDIVSLVKLIIVQETGDDYEEMAAQQMSVCKLAVVYYKRSKDWAVPFTQQLWKKVGGAGSGTPICLIGDSELNTDTEEAFTAPKVKPMILPLELIPLEVKVQYDIATEKN